MDGSRDPLPLMGLIGECAGRSRSRAPVIRYCNDLRAATTEKGLDPGKDEPGRGEHGEKQEPHHLLSRWQLGELRLHEFEIIAYRGEVRTGRVTFEQRERVTVWHALILCQTTVSRW